MRFRLWPCLGLLLATPALSDTAASDRARIMNCTFTQSCISGGCGEEDYNVTVEAHGSQAVLRDQQMTLTLTGGNNPATGQMSFASQPTAESAYFFSNFGAAGAVLSIHTTSEGQALVIAFEGRCEEVQ